MDISKEQGVYLEDGGQVSYLDIQVAVGISKHWGGYSATDELHIMCHLEKTNDVLEVGCGIG